MLRLGSRQMRTRAPLIGIRQEFLASGQGVPAALKGVAKDTFPFGSRGRWLVFGACTVVALFCASNSYWTALSYGRPDLTKAIWWNLMAWYGWACLMPAIFGVCRFLVKRRWVEFEAGQLAG